jgi:transcriptional regulator with XRE-family HTH domain
MTALPPEQCERIFAGESPLRVWREHRGLTADELAEEARVHPYTVQRVENGTKKPTTREMRRLAGALGIHEIDLGIHGKAYGGCSDLDIDEDEVLARSEDD